jgi:hypothetical protein
VNRSNPRHARCSVQADVWSFGVLLLDMVDLVRFGDRWILVSSVILEV